MTVLHEAAYYGKTESAKLLLDKGAEIDKQNKVKKQILKRKKILSIKFTFVYKKKKYIVGNNI